MKTYRELLFWVHIMLIAFAVIAGLFLPVLYVVIGIILHEVHARIFHGCALTQYEKKIHGIPKDADFFQYVVKRVLKIKVNKTTGKMINYSVLLLALLLSVARNNKLLF